MSTTSAIAKPIDHIGRRDIWRAGAACCLYVVALGVGHSLEIAFGAEPVFWPEAGVALAGFLATSRNLWWLFGLFIGIASVIAGLTFGDGALAGLVFGLADGLVGLAGCLALQRQGERFDPLGKLSSLAYFILVSIVGAVVSGAAAAGTSGALGGAQFGEVWGLQLGGAGLGLLLAAPPIYVLLTRLNNRIAWRPSAGFLSAGMLAVIGTAAAYVGWPGNEGAIPLVVALTPVPFLVWVATRYSEVETAGLLLAVSILELCLAVIGYAPSAEAHWSPELRMLWLQGILLIRGGTILLLSGALAERRQAVSLAEDQATRLHSMIEAVPDAIIMIDEHGIVTFFSAAAERMFQYRSSEIVGQNVKILMPMPYHSEHDAYIERYLRTGEKRIIGIGRVVVGQRKDGTTFPIELAVGEALSKGRHLFTGLIRDISERQETERRLHELQDDLIHVSRLSAMGELASALAHELNQPLTAITNYLMATRQLVQRGPEHIERASDLIAKSADQATRASQVIRQLRNLVQKRQVERTPSDIDRLVDEASALAFIGLKEKGVRIAIKRQAGIPPVPVDRIQIQQVLINLIRNAVDAMESMERRELTIKTESVDGRVRISIIDTGAGIAPGMEEKLFQAFVTTKETGMGVGLSISRTIAEAHGGELWFEPNPAGGTIFHLSLPLDGSAP